MSRAEILGCYYGLGDIDALQRYEQENRERDKHNLSMAAMCDFAFTQHSRDNPHPFCPQPLRFVRISKADKYVDDVDLHRYCEGLFDMLVALSMDTSSTTTSRMCCSSFGGAGLYTLSPFSEIH